MTGNPPSAAQRAPTDGARALRRRRAALWLFPVAVVLGVMVLSALQISGSSIGALADTTHDPGLLYGQPRAIRSDEWLLSSPEAIGNVRRGFPTRTWVGLTPTDLPASGLGIPSRHWSEAFHPGDWLFFVAPVETGFAWRWWVPLLAGLLGTYALLVQLIRGPLISAALATVLALSPYSAWWSGSPSPIVGYLAACAACVIFALRRRRARAAVPWGLAGGYFAATAGLYLYPPWLISVGLVVLAVIVGVALDERVGRRRFALVTASALVVLVAPMVKLAREAAPTLSAIAGTIYPGNRISPGGGASLRWLLDAPASLWMSGVPGVRNGASLSGHEVARNGLALFTNTSEASATWLPLPLVLAALVAALVAARAPGSESHPPRTDPPRRWTTVLVGTVLVLLLAWALLPLPAWFGDVTLLNRVPGYRTPLALGLAAVVLLGLGTCAGRRRRSPGWLVTLVVLATAASVAAMVWATSTLHWKGHHPALRGVLALCLVAGLGFGLLLLGRWSSRVAAVLVALVAAAVFVPVNPLYRGLGPMSSDPVVRALRPYVSADHAPRAGVYGGDERLNALVISTGMISLTGLTIFPDRAFWERVDPEQESLWNNYAKYRWIPDETRDRPLIQPTAGSDRLLRIDPCSSITRELGIEYSISTTPLTKDTCLTLIRTVPRDGGPVYLYRYAT